jgi:endonuclease/exonuclease/phosphatase family metal-dependent hydrolase
MDARPLNGRQRQRQRALSSIAWLPGVYLLVAESGCVTGPPSTVHIRPSDELAPVVSVRALSASLKVATFNVWGLPSWVNRASAERYPKIAREFGRLGSDVVLLQEVWTEQCFEELSRPAGGGAHGWCAAWARRKGGFLGQNGLLTLSRYPIEGAEVRHFSIGSLPDSLMHKGALKITVRVGDGQRVNIWNVHLQAGDATRVRLRQISELAKWVRAAENGQIADIVGGDFNSTPESEEFRQLVATLGPSVHQLARTTPLPTWDGPEAAAGGGDTLDHIFVRMRPSADEVSARPERIFAAARREDRLSDHMGVQALLTFGREREEGAAIFVLGTAASGRPGTTALSGP